MHYLRLLFGHDLVRDRRGVEVGSEAHVWNMLGQRARVVRALLRRPFDALQLLACLPEHFIPRRSCFRNLRVANFSTLHVKQFLPRRVARHRFQRRLRPLCRPVRRPELCADEDGGGFVFPHHIGMLHAVFRLGLLQHGIPSETRSRARSVARAGAKLKK